VLVPSALVAQVVEVEEAREVFAANQEMMAAHNARFEQGLETFTMGLNQFSHLTSKQFKAWMHNPMNRTRPRNEVTLPTDVPTSVDWREKGAVTAVRTRTLHASFPTHRALPKHSS
jgi:hypothetical protein